MKLKNLTQPFITGFLILFLSNLLFSQNLVIDPSFEATEHGLKKGTWKNLYVLTAEGSVGSSDLHDAKNPEDNINHGLCKSIDPYDGEKTIGIWLVGFKKWSYKGREYIQGSLKKTLVKGERYIVQMYVRMSDYENMLPLTDIGVLFTSYPIKMGDLNTKENRHLPLRARSKLISSNSKWQLIEAIYEAKGGEEFITIGGFLGASYHHLNQVDTYKRVYSYYFFDAVNVEKVSGEIEDIVIHEKKVEEAISLRPKQHILFDYNTSTIKSEYSSLIEQATIFLQENPHVSIELEGHTDNRGSLSYNQQLSEKRAIALKSAFIKKGISTGRITTLGKGSQQNIAINANEQGQQANRRCELRFVYSKELSDIQLYAIHDFAKIYGYIRYFYPSSQLESFDWNRFATYGIQKIRTVTTKNELIRTLQELFTSVAPEIRICESDDCSINVLTDTDYLFWQHLGLDSGGNEVYQSKLVSTNDKSNWLFNVNPTKKTIRKTGKLGITYEIPLILPSSSQIDISPLDKMIEETLLLDQDKYLANTIIIWNIIQHFHPYLSDLKLEWENLLFTYIQEVGQLKEEVDFSLFLKRMTVAIKDGHAGAYHPSEATKMFLPFKIKKVNDELVITQSGNEKIKKGDILKSIDDKVATELWKKDTALISGTKQWKIERANIGIGVEEQGSMADLEIKRQGKSTQILVERDWGDYPIPEIIQEVEKDIFYVDLKNIYDIDTLVNGMNRFTTAKAIIFDVRGYLYNDYSTLLTHLMTVPDTINHCFQTPQIVEPDQENITFKKEGWSIQPKLPKLSGKYFFLTNGSAISSSESFMAFVKYYKLGTIIGTPTAGANGSRNWIKLPLGYTFNWTGMYVTDLSGKSYYNKGIQPDIYLEPSSWQHDTVLKEAMKLAIE